MVFYHLMGRVPCINKSKESFYVHVSCEPQLLLNPTQSFFPDIQKGREEMEGQKTVCQFYLH